MFANSDDNTNTLTNDVLNIMKRAGIEYDKKTYLMTSNKRSFRGDRPIVLGSVEISVANTSAVKSDETFAREKFTGLLDGVVVPDFQTAAEGRNDSSFLRLGNNEVGGHSASER